MSVHAVTEEMCVSMCRVQHRLYVTHIATVNLYFNITGFKRELTVSSVQPAAHISNTDWLYL